MSEDKNDKQNDDEAMDITEFEISETIEVAIEMQSTHVRMDSSEFEAKLTEFFTKHKPSKLKLVSRIAFEFKGQEAFVLEHLNRKYVLGLAPEKVQKKVAHKAAGHGHDAHDEHPKNIESHSEEKPKSKKKLIMFIIIGVVVVGLGVTGFMMKDKLMAMTGMGGHATEHGAEAGAAGHAAEPKKEVAPKVEVVDSTKTVAVDSASTVAADSAITH
ncbi:MAG: hypothetical protein Q8L90_12730 [Bacteroidota bacterium]|nr:hypothetical protein [Bacteroidota bacterium]